MQRVLVTGASGFLGKALVENLLENGIEVYAVVHSKENSLAIEHGNLTVLACAMQHINSLSERQEGFGEIIPFRWQMCHRPVL